MNIDVSKWDRRYLELAQHIARWSRDPSTKVGAIIVNPHDKRVVSMGFNGFPRSIYDDEERYLNREIKYALIAHAERNALDQAEMPVHGYWMYCTLCPCSECAKSIIQRGIQRVVCPIPTKEQEHRWGQSFTWTQRMFEEAGVTLVWNP